MAALIREPPRERRPGATHQPARLGRRARRVRDRAGLRSGGGHRQAAGFSSDDSIEEITEFIRREFAAARDAA